MAENNYLFIDIFLDDTIIGLFKDIETYIEVIYLTDLEKIKQSYNL